MPRRGVPGVLVASPDAARGCTSAELRELLASSGFQVSEDKALQGQEPRHAPPPTALDDRVRQFLIERWPSGLFEHQARAIEAALGGRDVCLATSTAS